MGFGHYGVRSLWGSIIIGFDHYGFSHYGVRSLWGLVIMGFGHYRVPSFWSSIIMGIGDLLIVIFFQVSEKLDILTDYLRTTYFYCVWCGTTFSGMSVGPALQRTITND